MTAMSNERSGVMRVLLVEDKPERVRLFGQIYGGQLFAAVTTGEEAVELIREGQYELLHLDYGLAGELTGADVAREIVLQQTRPRVLVHSENLSGVMAIQEVLPEAGYVPFHIYETRVRRIKRLKEYLARPGRRIEVDTVVAIISGTEAG